MYVIGEGNARRFADRIVAWCIHNKVSHEAVSENFKVVPVRVGVDNDKERAAFIAADHGQYDVTIFDTMARNMDGDENATRDMSKTIAAIDEIRAVYHSAGGFAHHTGKDVTKGARGSSALAGAVDALIEVKHNQASGEAVVTLYRSRDSEQGVSRIFKPKRIHVSGDDFDEDARYSLVMEFVREGGVDDQKAAAAPLTGEPKTAAEKILVYLAEHNGVASQKDMESDEPGMSHANVNKAFVALRKSKLVTGTGPIFLSKKGQARAMELGAVIDAEIDE
ncbi:MAG: AAA family ATPase [Devosia sp.]